MTSQQHLQTLREAKAGFGEWLVAQKVVGPPEATTGWAWPEGPTNGHTKLHYFAPTNRRRLGGPSDAPRFVSACSKHDHYWKLPVMLKAVEHSKSRTLARRKADVKRLYCSTCYRKAPREAKAGITKGL
jgi:hypothetical protein